MNTKVLILMAATWLSLCSLGWAADGVWQSLNPAYFMKQVESIDVGYTAANEKYVYASEATPDGKIWYSTNDGNSWTDAGLFVEDHLTVDVAVEQSDFDIAWALVRGNYAFDDEGGPFRYIGDEDRWEHKINGLDNHFLLYCMATDYNDADLDKVLVGGGGTSFWGGYVFRTENGGDSWENVSDNIPDIDWPHNRVADIAFAPSNSQIAYFILQAYESGAFTRGLYMSTDAGLNWTFMGPVILPGESFFDFQATSLAVDPWDPYRVLVGNSAVTYGNAVRVLETGDGGASWDLFYTQTEGEQAICNDILMTSFPDVYLALYSSWSPTDGQFVWSEVWGPLPWEPGAEQPGDKRALALAVDPRGDNYVYIGTAGMLYRSDFYGQTVQPRVDGANLITDVKGIAVDLPNIHFMGNPYPYGSIYRSTDYGLIWSVRQSSFNIVNSTFIHSDQGQAGLLFAGNIDTDDYNFVYFYRSTDNGETWSLPNGLPAFPGGSVNCLTADPGDDYVYFGVTGGADRGLYWSSANGDNPTRYTTYPESPNINPLDIVIHPTQPLTLVVADGLLGLNRTTDRGATPFASIGFLGAYVNRIRYCPGQPDIALAATQSGIYKSTNMSQGLPTWTQSNYGGYTGPIEDLEFHPGDNSIVCICADDNGTGRFFISGDTARSWIELDPEFGDHIIHDLAVDIDYPDTFYAATDDGVYKLKNPVKCGDILASETWGPGTVIVNGDVTVPAGVTLTIEPGTTVKFVYNFDKVGSGANNSKSEIIIYGNLIAGGETGDAVVFQSSRHELLPNQNDWYGIYAGVGSHVTMVNCQVRESEYGIFGYKPTELFVEKTLFENIGTTGIYLTLIPESNPPEINFCRMHACGTYGIRCISRYFTALKDTIEDCKYGISYTGDMTPVIDSCKITWATGASNYGIYISRQTSQCSPIIRGCYVQGFGQGGIYMYGVSNAALLTYSTVYQSGLYGINCVSSSPDIYGGPGTRNLLQGNTNGLWLASNSYPDIKRTKFYTNSSKNLHISAGCWPDIRGLDEANANSFYSLFVFPYYDLYNANQNIIDATSNFWGEYFPVPSQIWNAAYDPYFHEDHLPRLAPPAQQSARVGDFSASVFPNPSNPTATIRFSLSSPEQMSVKIYNIMGQEIATVFDGVGQAGENVVVWNGRDKAEEVVSSGLYFCKLKSGESQETLKMTVLK
jgi:hypothetical protein